MDAATPNPRKTTMRTLTAIATTLALLTSTAIAKPRHARKTAKLDAPTMVACLKAHTTDDDAVKTCTSVAKHQNKIAKLAERIHKAVEACEEAVSIACEDTTERDHDGGECSDETLRLQHAFDVCHPPVDSVSVAKGGK